jgi:hypothetical protein
MDALQLLLLFVRTYLELKLFILIVFYNYSFLIIKILTVFNIN